MSSPIFKTTEVAALYEEIRDWCHPEYPFHDPNYSPGSSVPAIDLTPYVTTWLATGREDAILDLLSFFTSRTYTLQKTLRAALPSWVELSETARHELHAIYILSMRTAAAKTATRLAATSLACRQLTLNPDFANELIKLLCSELKPDTDTDLDSTQRDLDAARLALEKAVSPLGLAEPAAERLKAVPPITRLVVCDYIERDWAEGMLRFNLYYEDRGYGCGTQSNRQYVDWLGFFGPPNDEAKIPSTVTKDILFEALQQRGTQCKKSASRKVMLEQAHGIPGLLSELISRHRPEQRVLLLDWKESVTEWTQRVKQVEPVAVALIKCMALIALNKNNANNDFFKKLSLDCLFNTMIHVANGAQQFLGENLSQGMVNNFPALEFKQVCDCEPPETTWNVRWQAACAAAGDDKANKVFTCTGRMVALKSSDVWQQLGNGAGGYDDALGNPFPPFVPESEFRTESVGWMEAERLGLLKRGETTKPATIDFPNLLTPK